MAGAVTVPSAFALPTVSFTDGPGNTGGGEFNAATSADGSFTTFCLEYTEHISFGTTYFYQVSDAAKYNNNFPNTDPLSLPTAWLYSKMLDGTLAGYAHNQTEADNLQRAIWFLEDEKDLSGNAVGVNNSYVTAALNGTGLTLATKDTAANGAYGVHVMNLWTNPDGTGPSQDQLIHVPDGGTTLTLLGMGMGFMALVSRRLRS